MVQTRKTTETSKRRPAVRKMMRQFGRDEDGSMIVFSIFLLVLMLILGGMAVDFMRFESRRAELQGISDRAALAAANLQADRTKEEAAAVATDYFQIEGMADALTNPPVVTNEDNFRSVRINADVDLDTFFLKLVGIHNLNATAAATAVEGVGNVEISLVLDISGSMGFEAFNEDGTSTNTTKIVKLREAAVAFVESVLHSDYEDKISVSLIPYSQNVNAGPFLFNGLNTQHRHDFSHCVEFEDSDFTTTAISTTKLYDQGHNVQTNPLYDNNWNFVNDRSEPVCPRYSYERITHITQNLTTLRTQILSLQPRAGTSIFLGLKWGLALLDDSMKTVVAPGLDPAFAGRPVAFTDPTSPNRTSKVVVLMTDGENQSSSYIKPEYYSTPSDYAHWDDFNWHYYRSNHLSGTGIGTSDWFYTRYNAPAFNTNYGGNASNGDTLTQNLCDAARQQGIVIFAIAFDAGSHGEQTMADCATTPNHFFNASGGELKAIFEAIAAQITDLRLTQ